MAKTVSHFGAAVRDLVRSTVVPEDDVLVESRKRALAAGLPAIEIAPEDGSLLALLVRLAQPALVVEIGTLFGYSAIWMARALPPGGRLITIESEARHAAVARENLAAAGLSDTVTVRVGDARELLVGIGAPVDAVFVDADKPSYPTYLAWARQALAPGGLFAADNAFQGGRVAAPGPDDPGAAAVRAMLETLAADDGWQQAIVPTLEGMALAIRSGRG